MQLISVDIGSTYTKGALLVLRDGQLHVQARASVPTTQDDLTTGFVQVLLALGVLEEKTQLETLAPTIPVYVSSSAKGGLSIAAVGLVPNVTMEAARLTALSAGGRVSRVFSYLLTAADIELLEQNPPDIILLSGGTDGGNERYVRQNARRLAASTVPSCIVYAGNRQAAEDVERCLRGKPFTVTENILPALDCLNPEPARQVIRELFLQRIVQGKGLERLIRVLRHDPLPTPLAILEFVKILHKHGTDLEDFCLVDVGGATTDYYSALCHPLPGPETVYRGIPEPRIKRTVEGDLGLRVSACSVLDAAGPSLEADVAHAGHRMESLQAYARHVEAAPGHLAACADEACYDRLLFSTCVSIATQRHAGRLRSVYTADGERHVQTGRDLRHVRRIVLTGGYAAHMNLDHCIPAMATVPVDDTGSSILAPRSPVCWIDRDHLVPLAANVAAAHPEAATRLVHDNLVRTRAATVHPHEHPRTSP